MSSRGCRHELHRVRVVGVGFDGVGLVDRWTLFVLGCGVFRPVRSTSRPTLSRIRFEVADFAVRPFQAGPQLFAVWRAANDIRDTDVLPAGRAVAASRERGYQRHLEARINVLAGPRVPLPSRVIDLLRGQQPRCSTTRSGLTVPAARGRRPDGQDLHALVTAALEQGPLPEERPAAALWFRLAGQLRLVSAEADADADIRLRPDWTDRLLRLLPDQAAHRVLDQPRLAGTRRRRCRHGHPHRAARGRAARPGRRRDQLRFPPNRGGFLLGRGRLVGGQVLVVDRAHHTSAAMPPAMVVEVVAPVQHDRPGVVGIGELVAGQHLPFQGGEE